MGACLWIRRDPPLAVTLSSDRSLTGSDVVWEPLRERCCPRSMVAKVITFCCVVQQEIWSAYVRATTVMKLRNVLFIILI